jgi:uncharacterized Zn-binding protein involved in type VI secretion
VPHVGLHPSDPYAVPANQIGTVKMGCDSVLFEGKAAAHSGCLTEVCFGVPGQLLGSAASVVIGP